MDNKRPKMCADRLDGIILTGMFWTRDINLFDIKELCSNSSIKV